jgi:alginate O-acetyltransferase complex protein AlgI
VLLLMGSALLNHFFGLGIGAAAAPRKRRLLLAAGLGFNIALLAVFKYAAFILANLGALPVAAAAGTTLPWHQPLGISFFTFMAMAYLVEVYQRAIPAERNPVHTALAISFFPVVLAGPINRYSSLGRQLAGRQPDAELLAQGVRRFIIGLGKKVLLADTLARAVDAIFAIPASGLTASLAWLGAAGYTLQIFLDFSGYSDMAIGLGRMFGFTFMENFNYPYMSKSITEFWTRWHISLSTWLRDFLFLPLAYASSRRLKADRWLGIRADSWCYYPAMLLTMLLCGVWHGAASTFIAWGLYHGLFIVLERQALKKRLQALWPALQGAYSLLVVAFGWVLFRALDFSQASAFWRAMIGLGSGDGREFHAALYLNGLLIFAAAAGLIAAVPVVPALRGWEGRRLAGPRRGSLRLGWRLLEATVLLVVLVASVMFLAASTFNPFIYARF